VVEKARGQHCVRIWADDEGNEPGLLFPRAADADAASGPDAARSFAASRPFF
jgi:hypothetical protein